MLKSATRNIIALTYALLLLAGASACLPEGSVLDVTAKPADTSGARLSFAGFSGATSAVDLNGSQITVSWDLSTDPAVAGYMIYGVAVDGSLSPIKAVKPDTNTATLNGLTSGKAYTFRVRAKNEQDQYDSNTIDVSTIAYDGITGASVTGASTATVAFSTAADADAIRVYCKSFDTAYSSTPDAIVTNPIATSAELTGLVSGAAYTCKAVAVLAGIEDSNQAATSFTPLGTASKLAFTVQPPLVNAAGVAFTTGPVVTLQDAVGNALTAGADATAVVTLEVSVTSKTSGTVRGTATVTAVAGVADFTGLINIQEAGTKILRATATLNSGGTLIQDSGSFSVSAGTAVAANSSITISSTTTPMANNSDSPTITIVLKDAFGNAISGIKPKFISDNVSDKVTQPTANTTAAGVSTSGSLKTTAAGIRNVAISSPVGLSSVTTTSTFSPNLTFSGATSATTVSETQIQLAWTKGTGTSIAGYKVYEQLADATLSLLTTVPLDATAVSYTHSGLIDGSKHTYIVRAATTGGAEEDPNTIKVSAFAYSGIASRTVTGTTTASVTFAAATGASFLRVYCQEGSGAFAKKGSDITPASTSVGLTGLTPGTAYTCKVYPVDSSGAEYATTNTLSFTPPILTFAGATNAVTTSANSITVNWSTASVGANVTSYALYEVSLTDGSLTLVGTRNNTYSSYLVTGLTGGSFHKYTVRALDSTGNVDDGNTVKVSAFAYAITSATATGGTTATLTFPAATFPATLSPGVLNIYCKFGAGNYPGTPTASVASTLTTKNLTGLTAGQLATCKVIPADILNQEYANTAELTFTPTPLLSFAGAASAETTSATSITLNWSIASVGADIATYKIYEVSLADGSLSFITSRANTYTSYPVTGLTAGTYHKYRVRAYDSSGNFNDGNTVDVSAFAYGITSATATATTTGTLTFPAATFPAALAPGGLNIYCKVGAGSYPGTPSAVSSSAVTKDLTGLTPGQTTTCKVIPVDLVGHEYANTVEQSLTPRDLTFLGATSAETTSTTSITVRWSAGTGPDIDTYGIYEVVGGVVSGSAVGTVAKTFSSYVVTGLTNGTFHKYVVRARDATATLTDGNSTQVSAFAYGATAAVANTTTTATLSFPAPSPTTSASTLNIYCKYGAGSYPIAGSPTTSVAATITTKSLSGLTPGQLVTCKVIPVDSLNLEYANSTEVTLTPPNLTFGGATSAATAGPNSITINWSLAGLGSDIDTLKIYEVNGDGSLTLIQSLLKTFATATITGLTNGTYHTYRVRAFDSSGTFNDGNSTNVSALAYGITSASSTGATTGTLGFPAAAFPAALSSGASLNVYCSIGGGSYTLTANISASLTSKNLTGLTTGSVTACKIYPVDSQNQEYTNSTTQSFTPLPYLAFGGATSAVTASTTSITVSWTLPVGAPSADIASYAVYDVTGAATLVATTGSGSASATITGLTTGSFHSYRVRALDGTGNFNDGNVVQASTFAYGVTSATATGTTTATVNFPAASSASTLNIYCKVFPGGTYSGTPNLSGISASSTSASVTGLTTGRTYKCKVQPLISSTEYANSTDSSSFQTTSNSSSNYQGVMLVSAYGPAPTAPSGTPSAQQVTVTWNQFKNASAGTNYVLERTIRGGTLDMTNTTACTSGTTTSCRVGTASGMGPKTLTDLNVAANTVGNPAQYDYAITTVATDTIAEELPTSDTGYRITVYIPPPNMVLVHRDSANYEMCVNKMGRTMGSSLASPYGGPDPLNHQRCTYSGLGAVAAYSGTDLSRPLSLTAGYYDFGYDLFVDRWQAGCAWSLSGTTKGKCGANAANGDCTGYNAFPLHSFQGTQGLDGSVFYYMTTASWFNQCFVKETGVWRDVNGGASQAGLALAVTNAPNPTAKVPPIQGITQANAYAACQALSDVNYGQKRLLRRREQIAAAAWANMTGEPGVLGESAIVTMESGWNGLSTAHTTLGLCNADAHSGQTVPNSTATFNVNEMSLSHAFDIGSAATNQCVSRFGAQDMVGNAPQWLSDSVTCNAVTHICTGTTSPLDPGNIDFNGITFDGATGAGNHGPGGATTTVWQIGTPSYSANYFSAPLSIPLTGTDTVNSVQNALTIAGGSPSSIAAAKLHASRFNLATDTTGVRAAAFGSDYISSSPWAKPEGNYSLNLSALNSASGINGFRCALPAY